MVIHLWDASADFVLNQILGEVKAFSYIPLTALAVM